MKGPCPGGHMRVDVPAWMRQRVCSLIAGTSRRRAWCELGVSPQTLDELSEPCGRVLGVTLERIERRLREMEGS